MRHGLDNMKIQASLAAAALNLKRLGAALGAVLWAIRTAEDAGEDPLCIHHGQAHRTRPPRAPRPERGFLHSPTGVFSGTRATPSPARPTTIAVRSCAGALTARDLKEAQQDL